MAVMHAIMLVLIAMTGAAVVFTRKPINQAVISSFFGLLLAIYFFTVQAPDVSLAAIVVGAVGLPLMILMALARVHAKR